MNNTELKISKRSEKSPITGKDVKICISDNILKSTNSSILFKLKNFIKKISGIGIVMPDLYYEKELDFAFFQRLSDKFLDSYYINDGKINSTEDTLLRKNFALSPAMNNTAKIILGWIEKNTNLKKKIDGCVDYGAGTGWMSLEMSNHNYGEITATDISYDTIKHITELNSKIKLLDLNDFYNSNIKFDLITLIDVLEHLNDPLEVLRKIHNKASSETVIFISVPNFNSYFSKVHLGNHPYFSYPHHLNYFTKKSLSYAVEASGFIVTNVIATTLPYEIEYIAKNFPKKLNCKTSWVLWDKLMDKDLGERLFMVAIKK